MLAGDLITIRSAFQEVREKALLFMHEMTNERRRKWPLGTFLTGVCLDTKIRKARPLPEDVRHRIVTTFTAGAHNQESGGIRKQGAQ